MNKGFITGKRLTELPANMNIDIPSKFWPHILVISQNQ